MKYLSSLLIFISYVAVPRWCNNCVHFIPCPVGEEFGQCSMFPIVKKDNFLVTGKKKPTTQEEYSYCSTARTFNHMCGKRGHLFFPKKYLLNSS